MNKPPVGYRPLVSAERINRDDLYYQTGVGWSPVREFDCGFMWHPEMGEYARLEARCTTHHHACDCRERMLHEAVQQAARALKEHGAMQEYAHLKEVWRSLYGGDLIK